MNTEDFAFDDFWWMSCNVDNSSAVGKTNDIQFSLIISSLHMW